MMEPLFIILAIVVAFALVLGRIAARRSGATVRRSPDLLLTACLGNRAKAQRLADFEKRKAPSITEMEARRRALDRLTRDQMFLGKRQGFDVSKSP